MTSPSSKKTLKSLNPLSYVLLVLLFIAFLFHLNNISHLDITSTTPRRRSHDFLHSKRYAIPNNFSKPYHKCHHAVIVPAPSEITNITTQIPFHPLFCTIIFSAKPLSYIALLPNDTINLTPFSPFLPPYSLLRTLTPTSLHNLAYLYALHAGAETILDYPANSILKNVSNLLYLISLPKSTLPINSSEDSHHLFNPFPYFQPNFPIHIAPRGFPPAYIRDKATVSTHITQSSREDVAVYAAISNPASVSVSQPTFMSFRDSKTEIALSPGRVAPFSSASLWTRSAAYVLFMPLSRQPSTARILRSYILQALMRADGKRIAFVSPIIIEDDEHRDKKAYAVESAKFDAISDDIVTYLSTVQEGGLKGLVELAIGLYEKEVLGEEDVDFLEAWVSDLRAIGYGNDHTQQAHVGKIEIKEPNPEVGNVAVCVSGQVRTLTLGVDAKDHPHKWVGMRSNLPAPNMTVADSIQQKMFPKLGKADVFMVVSTQGTEREPKVGNKEACEPLRNKGGHLQCEVVREEQVVENELDLWRKFFLANVKSEDAKWAIQGFLQQLKGMYQCHKEILKHSLRTGKEYDWMVRLRPDTYVAEFPDLSTLAKDMDGPTVWYGSFGVCCCGNEDRFGIGHTKVMQKYFDRFLEVQQVKWKYRWGWNAEYFLERLMNNTGISLKPHPGIQICTLKPLSRKYRSDP